MKKDWKYEIARDIIAIAGVPFFLVILIRALVGPFWSFVYQLSTAGILLLLFWMFFKNSNYYASRGIILWIFSSLFYQDGVYAGFTFLILLGLFGAMFYLKTKKEEILYGVVIGVVVSAVVYYVVPLMPLVA